jgi:hypothetical protein
VSDEFFAAQEQWSGLNATEMATSMKLSGNAVHWVISFVAAFFAYAPTALAADQFLNAGDAPPAWTAFASRLKIACEKELRAGNDVSRRLKDRLTKIQANAVPGTDPMRVAVKIWVAPAGVVSRVSFPPLSDEQATRELQTVLLRATPGAPPANLLQPVQLSISLKPRSQP